MSRGNGWNIVGALLVLAVAGTGRQVEAQLAGHNTRGDFGLSAATQPDPRFYLSAIYLNYSTSTIRNRNGDKLPTGGSLTVNAIAPMVWYVSDLKILGANYGVMAWIPFQSNALEAPGIGINVSSDFGVGDLYVQPINLGWHLAQADIMAGFGVYAPTGRFTQGANDNTGLGMWSYEFQGGATAFFDRAKSWSIAALGSFETASEKEDVDIKVGNILTVEGGLGKSFFDGAAQIGAAYFAQWKLSKDRIGSNPSINLNKARTFGIGPEVALPIPLRKKVVALVRARYLWETGSRSTTEGNTFVGMLTVPLPGFPIE
jgi:hypothetical protein